MSEFRCADGDPTTHRWNELLARATDLTSNLLQHTYMVIMTLTETPFAQLYYSLFRDQIADCLSDYTFIRHIDDDNDGNDRSYLVKRSTRSNCNSTQQDEHYMMRCKSIQYDDADAISTILKTLTLHQAASKRNNHKRNRILPLLSHFLSKTTYDASGRVIAGGANVYVMMISPYCPIGTLHHYLVIKDQTQVPIVSISQSEVEAKLRWVIIQAMKALKQCTKLGITFSQVCMQDFILWEAPQQKNHTGPRQLLVSISA